MSGLEPWPSALCQARVWAVPDAGSFLTERALAWPCVPAQDPATEGRNRPGTLQTWDSHSELELTTNPGALRGALPRMLLGKAASPSSPAVCGHTAALPPVLFLIVPL